MYYEEVEMILDKALKDTSKKVYFYSKYEAYKYILKKLNIKGSTKNRAKIEQYMTRYQKLKGRKILD